MIDTALNAIGQRISEFFGPLLAWAYLLEWYVWLAALLALCLLIGYFAQFKWVRAILGIIVLVAGAFVAGGTVMFRHLRERKTKPPREYPSEHGPFWS